MGGVFDRRPASVGPVILFGPQLSRITRPVRAVSPFLVERFKIPAELPRRVQHVRPSAPGAYRLPALRGTVARYPVTASAAGASSAVTSGTASGSSMARRASSAAASGVSGGGGGGGGAAAARERPSWMS